MPLTDTKIKTAKAKEKPYKLTDAGGMYLLVNPNGSKYWQYRFRLNQKQGTYQIGSYPDVSLKKARDEHLLARQCVTEGTNPKTIKIERKAKEQGDLHRFNYYAMLTLPPPKHPLFYFPRHLISPSLLLNKYNTDH